MQLSAKNLISMSLGVLAVGALLVGGYAYQQASQQKAFTARAQTLATRMSQQLRLAESQIDNVAMVHSHAAGVPRSEPLDAPKAMNMPQSNPLEGERELTQAPKSMPDRVETPASPPHPGLYATTDGAVDARHPLGTIDVPSDMDLELTSPGAESGSLVLVLRNGQQVFLGPHSPADKPAIVALTCHGLQAHLQIQPDGTVQVSP